MLKDRLSKTSGWQFHKWLFGPEKFSGLSRNGPPEDNKIYEQKYTCSTGNSCSSCSSCSSFSSCSCHGRCSACSGSNAPGEGEGVLKKIYVGRFRPDV